MKRTISITFGCDCTDDEGCGCGEALGNLIADVADTVTEWGFDKHSLSVFDGED